MKRWLPAQRLSCGRQSMSLRRGHRRADAIVTEVLEWPLFHASEICIFFDRDYFLSLNPAAVAPPPGPAFSVRLGVKVLASFSEVGYLILPPEDDDGAWEGSDLEEGDEADDRPWGAPLKAAKIVSDGTMSSVTIHG